MSCKILEAIYPLPEVEEGPDGAPLYRIADKAWQIAREVWMEGTMHLVIHGVLPDSDMRHYDVLNNPSGLVH